MDVAWRDRLVSSVLSRAVIRLEGHHLHLLHQSHTSLRRVKTKCLYRWVPLYPKKLKLKLVFIWSILNTVTESLLCYSAHLVWNIAQIEGFLLDFAKSIFGLSTQQLRWFRQNLDVLVPPLKVSKDQLGQIQCTPIWSDAETRDKGGWTSHRSCLSTASGFVCSDSVGPGWSGPKTVSWQTYRYPFLQAKKVKSGLMESRMSQVSLQHSATRIIRNWFFALFSIVPPKGKTPLTTLTAGDRRKMP